MWKFVMFKSLHATKCALKDKLDNKQVAMYGSFYLLKLE